MTWQLILGTALTAYTLSLQAESLSYPQALCRIEEQNRPLKAAEAEMQMRLADAWQAGLVPNPLLSVEVDDFAGTGYYRGFKHAEYALSLTQPFDLSGKRVARSNLALASVCKSYWAYETLRQRIIKDLNEAFIIAAAAQEHLKVTDEQHQIAQSSLTCTSEKAASGKVPPFHEKRAIIACNISKLSHEKAKSDAYSALTAIANLLGEPCFYYEAIDYPFFDVKPPRPYCYYEDNLDNNAELASARMDVYVAGQANVLERANWLPDLDVTATISNDNDKDTTSFSLGFAIPLPIFDRNQGNICRSSWQTHQADYLQQDLEVNLRTRLMVAYRRLVQAYEAVVSLQGDVQKCVKDNLEAAQEGYKQGKIEQLELLDAHRSCSEINDHYIESLKDYHLRLIEVENIAPSCGA